MSGSGCERIRACWLPKAASRSALIASVSAVVLFLAGNTASAMVLTNRPAADDLEYAVDAGIWCGRGLEERRMALDNGNKFLPRRSSQRVCLEGLKPGIADCIGQYVAHTAATAFCFNDYFSLAKTNDFPLWTSDGVVRAAGCPTNYLYYTPQQDLRNHSNGWDGARRIITNLLATRKLALPSNAYAVVWFAATNSEYTSWSTNYSGEWELCYKEYEEFDCGDGEGSFTYGVKVDGCLNPFDSLVVTTNRKISAWGNEPVVLYGFRSYWRIADNYTRRGVSASFDPSGGCICRDTFVETLEDVVATNLAMIVSVTGFAASVCATNLAAEVYLYEQLTNAYRALQSSVTNVAVYSVVATVPSWCNGEYWCLAPDPTNDYISGYHDPAYVVQTSAETNTVTWDMSVGMPSVELEFPYCRISKSTKNEGEGCVTFPVSYSVEGCDFKRYGRITPYAYNVYISCVGNPCDDSISTCTDLVESKDRSYAHEVETYSTQSKQFSISRLMHLYVWNFAYR